MSDKSVEDVDYIPPNANDTDAYNILLSKDTCVYCSSGYSKSMPHKKCPHCGEFFEYSLFRLNLYPALCVAVMLIVMAVMVSVTSANGVYIGVENSNIDERSHDIYVKNMIMYSNNKLLEENEKNGNVDAYRTKQINILSDLSIMYKPTDNLGVRPRSKWVQYVDLYIKNMIRKSTTIE